MELKNFMQQKCSAFLWKNQINKITRSGDCAYQNYKILVRAQIFYRLTLMQSFSCNLAFGNLRKTITCHKIPVISIFQVDALVQHYFQHYFIRFLFLKCFSVLPWNYANLSKRIGRTQNSNTSCRCFNWSRFSEKLLCNNQPRRGKFFLDKSSLRQVLSCQ